MVSCVKLKLHMCKQLFYMCFFNEPAVPIVLSEHSLCMQWPCIPTSLTGCFARVGGMSNRRGGGGERKREGRSGGGSGI